MEAGAAIGKSKSTVLRAIRRGILSATRDEATSGWLIDPAELHRVYPPVAPGSAEPADDAPRNHEGTDATAEIRELHARLEAAELRLTDAHDQIADLRRRLDAEAEERRRLTAVLADRTAVAPEPTIPAVPPAPAQRWWPWRRQ